MREAGDADSLGLPLQHGSAAVCSPVRSVCSDPAYGPAQPELTPRPALRYFAIVLVAAGIMRWANRRRNVPVEKPRFKPGGHSKQTQ